ncbi:hypothetical protein LMG10661_02455 [Ralstonia syzygii subsp. syzygii]|nr:hypothetical protein LMG10661_02455 [Ralstonia syzygii subsp. syzygii]
MGEVADLLAMDRTTLTAAIKPLERRGLVAIETNPADRRSRLLRLRPAGLKALTRALPVWRALHGEIDGTLAHADPQRLRDHLRILSGNASVSLPASAPRR